MKKIIIIILTAFISSMQIYNPKPTFAENKFYYTTNIEHIFTHCLIAYPEIAFRKNNPMKKFYDADCLTPKEFKANLNALYFGNYALVSINDCFTSTKDGTAIKKQVRVPVGKKPLIMSFDDVNYDQKKLGKGMVDKIILDKGGNVACQTKLATNTIDISYNNEFVTILENFISSHPDFSINCARGTINLTGYDGILGYRTSHTNITNREEEIAEAKRVVNKLKKLGWTFASHSYGHYHMKKISDSKFESELNLWKQEVEPIVGKTQVYVYPYGEWEVFDKGNLCHKHKLLNDFGFKLFCGVGMKPFYSYLPNKYDNKVLFMDRKCLDGNSLRASHPELAKLFNPNQILDTIRH